MGAASWMFQVLVLLIAIGWCFQYFLAAAIARRIRVLDELAAAEPSIWPRLSVVIPACNEAETIENALQSLALQDYPDLELIVVDDRSTDSTGVIVDRIAANNPRIRAIHIEDLPKGWLGKVNALKRATDASSGELILATDADVHFAPGALSRAVAVLLADQIDHLSILPRLKADSLALDAMLSAFVVFFITTFRPGSRPSRVSKPYAGMGAFNLFRAEVFERTEGWSWLRLEVADDAGLALLLHRHGAKAELMFSRSDVSIHWYPSIAAMIGGFEKNMYGVFCHYSPVRAIALSLAIPVAVIAPLALTSPFVWIRLVGLVALSSVLLAALVLRQRAGRPLLGGLLAPFTAPASCLALLSAAWRVGRRKSVLWRGSTYPVEELRATQRVRL